MAYAPLVIPYPGAPGAPFFGGQNITDFLDRYSQLCSDYRLPESEKIRRLPWYCECFTGNYIKILIKGSDWAAVRSILRREYKDNDLDQLINSREFLEALKKKSRTKEDDVLYYCQQFASISKGLILRGRLDPFTQCQWFLQRLPETILTKMFYRHEIDLENDDGTDFDDLLEKAIVLVGCRTRLANFIGEKESSWTITNLQEDQPSAQVNHHCTSPVVLPPTATIPDIVRTVFSTTQDLAPTVRAVEGSASIARIGTVQAKKNETPELIESDDDCNLVLNHAKDILKDPSALFADSGSVDEDKCGLEFIQLA